jgi:hypothetical protein
MPSSISPFVRDRQSGFCCPPQASQIQNDGWLLLATYSRQDAAHLKWLITLPALVQIITKFHAQYLQTFNDDKSKLLDLMYRPQGSPGFMPYPYALSESMHYMEEPMRCIVCARKYKAHSCNTNLPPSPTYTRKNKERVVYFSFFLGGPLTFAVPRRVFCRFLRCLPVDRWC